VPDELRADLMTFQQSLAGVLSETGQDVAVERLDLGVTYLIVQFWTRLYGHVTLEVFGNYPIPMSKPDVLFEAMLIDLAHEVGLIDHRVSVPLSGVSKGPDRNIATASGLTHEWEFAGGPEIENPATSEPQEIRRMSDKARRPVDFVQESSGAGAVHDESLQRVNGGLERLFLALGPPPDDLLANESPKGDNRE
jgi:hypothetical protein